MIATLYDQFDNPFLDHPEDHFDEAPGNAEAGPSRLDYEYQEEFPDLEPDPEPVPKRNGKAPAKRSVRVVEPSDRNLQTRKTKSIPDTSQEQSPIP